MAKRFFSYDPDDASIVLWDSEQDARESAEATLKQWRNFANANGEWNDDADHICWGEVKQIATESLSAVVAGERFTDYELQEPRR